MVDILVLIKATLKSLLVYYLSLLKIPKRVANKINKIQRRFLWSAKQEGKYSLVMKQESVQKPNAEGGLGVGDLLLTNMTLLFKWWQRFVCEGSLLQKVVIQSLHKEDHVVLPPRTLSTLLGPQREKSGWLLRAFQTHRLSSII